LITKIMFSVLNTNAPTREMTTVCGGRRWILITNIS